MTLPNDIARNCRLCIPCREHSIVRTESATYPECTGSSASALRAGPEDECDLVEDAATSAPDFTVKQGGFRIPARQIVTTRYE